jgi:hypothetical protein
VESSFIVFIGVAAMAAFLFGAWARHREEGRGSLRSAFRPTKGKLAILLAFFLLLTALSVVQVYSAHSQPVQEENVITLAKYEHVGTYNYVARLKPNQFYENRLTLGPGEGVLYIRLVENIDVSFRYTFTCDRQANISTEYSMDMTFEAPEKWAKSFNVASENSIELTGRSAEFSEKLFIDLAWFDNLRRKIEEETGTSSSSYDLRIRPTIHTVAKTDVGTIDEVFSPELVLTLKYRAQEGDYIAVSGLENRSSGALRRVEVVRHPEVASRRRVSYVMMAVSLVGLALTCVGLAMVGPPKPEKPVEEMVKPFREAVIEIAAEPSHGGATVEMKSLEDLAVIAEGLGKPILHLRVPAKGGEVMHSFYVLDGQVRYEFKIKSKEGYGILR